MDVDYSISWAEIVEAMEKMGYGPNSQERHEFAYFQHKLLGKIWDERFEKLFQSDPRNKPWLKKEKPRKKHRL